MIRTIFLAAALVLPLAACNPERTAQAPLPVEPTADARGYYCGMDLAEHPGPKGQIHLAAGGEPIWTSSVRDVFAYMALPEEDHAVTAIYVNDLAKARDWDHPEAGAWVEAREAYYVIGSPRPGAMGGAEALPFSSETAARAFAAAQGGEVRRFADVGKDFIFGAGSAEPDPSHAMGAMGH